MREIKFRAWFKDKQEMRSVATNNIYEGNTSYMYLSPMPGSNYELVEIMQYTGLKDKNGKEIYERDIVKTHDQNNVIKYQHGSFMLIGLHEDRYERNYSRLYHYLIDSTIPNMEGSRFDGVTTTLEIVGNIYENPELIK